VSEIRWVNVLERVLAIEVMEATERDLANSLPAELAALTEEVRVKRRVNVLAMVSMTEALEARERE